MGRRTRYCEGVSDEHAPQLPNEGDVIADKYRIGAKLGSGGMGAVLAAEHVGLGVQVAIKFLHARAAGDPVKAARFAREARIGAKLQSEHVIRVSDTGVWREEVPYIVMEQLDGEDLSRFAREGGMAVTTAVDYVLQASEGLAEAHATSVTHRDLKPANLFLCRRPDGRELIKVLDFGISKVVDELNVDGDLTKTTALMGSPLYMPPERLRSGKEADPRGDIWAMGSILFELLTGQATFEGDTLPVVCSHILNSEPRRLRDYRPDAPEELESAILSCLDKNKDTRCPNLAVFGARIARFGGRDASGALTRIRKLLGVADDVDTADLAGTIVMPDSPTVSADHLPVSSGRVSVPHAAPGGPISAPHAAQASGPFAAQASGPFAAQASGPFAAQASGPYPAQASGPYAAQPQIQPGVAGSYGSGGYPQATAPASGPYAQPHGDVVTSIEASTSAITPPQRGGATAVAIGAALIVAGGVAAGAFFMMNGTPSASAPAANIADPEPTTTTSATTVETAAASAAPSAHVSANVSASASASVVATPPPVSGSPPRPPASPAKTSQPNRNGDDLFDDRKL